MEQVRLGIIGVGNMGTVHANRILRGEVPRCRLAAVCDVDTLRLEPFDEEETATYTDSAALIRSGEVDAVLIATPHYSHTTIGIDALANGLHVLVEKPISVHKADCERLAAAHSDANVVFAAMFNERTDPHYRQVKKLIDEGHLGQITRVNWTVTHWFRTETYYASGTWRATWEGEGGGVLLNQSPHQLDLLQWLCGMPTKVRAFCGLGKHHTIEVEDEVTAYLEYANGATGVFVTSTAEAPGTNRLEICGEMGRVLVEDGRIHFTRNEVSMVEYNRTSPEAFGKPPVWEIDVPADGRGGQHAEIIGNFCDAILDGTPLIAPAEEGIHSVELANSMLYSSLEDRVVTLPLDAAAYEKKLHSLIADSQFVKKTSTTSGVQNMDASFQ